MSKILIVEDEESIRRVLVKILSEEDKSHEIQVENYDLHGELEEKDKLIKELLIN